MSPMRGNTEMHGLSAPSYGGGSFVTGGGLMRTGSVVRDAEVTAAAALLQAATPVDDSRTSTPVAGGRGVHIGYDNDGQ